MRHIKVSIYGITLFVLLFGIGCAAVQATTAAGVAPPKMTLEKQVSLWKDELAKQPSFRSWKTANFEIAALGPGTHGWFISIVHQGTPIGYMIVNAREDGGFELGEYGQGSELLFNEKTLYHSMVQHGMIIIPADMDHYAIERLYSSPVQTVWKLTEQITKEIFFLDAFTGEQLPITNNQWNNAVRNKTLESTATKDTNLPFSKAPAQISASQLNAGFDPYERLPWLTEKPLSKVTEHSIAGLLKQQTPIWYTSEPFGNIYRYVWSVVGFQQWDNGSLYATVGQDDDLRFIPLPVLQKHGLFYLSTKQ
ncbi:hypothetical protein EBB07_25580 [Paenibacillaceae bacterium]|nr:hypothetical protein EBB07_25580 [Paenibacillaceae bacterium]